MSEIEEKSQINSQSYIVFIDNLPNNWEARIFNGKIFFINYINLIIQYKIPIKNYTEKTYEVNINNLPNNWEARIFNGKIFFIDHINKKTQYEKPYF